MGTGESQEWGLSGRVQRVGLMSWVNTRPLICLALPARFSNEFFLRFPFSHLKMLQSTRDNITH